MIARVLAGLLATALLVVFIAPVALKLMDPALLSVVLVGVVLMLIDLWQSLRS